MSPRPIGRIEFRLSCRDSKHIAAMTPVYAYKKGKFRTKSILPVEYHFSLILCLGQSHVRALVADYNQPGHKGTSKIRCHLDRKKDVMLALICKPLVLAIWFGSLVLCVLGTIYLSRKGYIRKDMIRADNEINPCPENTPIYRTINSALYYGIVRHADMLVVSINRRHVAIDYLSNGEVIKDASITTPLYTAIPFAMQLIALKNSSKHAGPIDEDSERHELRVRIDFDLAVGISKKGLPKDSITFTK